MVERKQVTGYVSEATHRSLQAKADAEGLSVSEYVGEAIEEKIERDGLESAADRYGIEERMLRLVDDAADRAADRIVERVAAAADAETENSEDTEDGGMYDWGDE
ncbi:hypothetical protein [Halococcus salifodinae]|uniref:Ribbon-helix-helix protein CopG domain-containing protein n=1 Tax=Halococcus salifodinae DSM 8989 TaxID=1227456 RepID=M0NG62_9EURY|nr:hypothetical protein [Halococcus salifodinae]EMA55685.1 hypothetical protein C450_01047 [Halococcus salifodinae DSM 8989]